MTNDEPLNCAAQVALAISRGGNDEADHAAFIVILEELKDRGTEQSVCPTCGTTDSMNCSDAYHVAPRDLVEVDRCADCANSRAVWCK